MGFIIWFPSGGLPRYARNDIVLRTQNNICSDYPPHLKSQNSDGFSGFLTGSCEGAYASQISLLTKQTNFNTFVCLLLVCSFSPKVQKYLLGSPSPIKRREFDEIVFFSAGSEKPSVLAYTIFQVLPKKQNIANSRRFYKKNFGRARVCSPRRLPEIISKCYDCGNAAC